MASALSVEDLLALTLDDVHWREDPTYRTVQRSGRAEERAAHEARTLNLGEP